MKIARIVASMLLVLPFKAWAAVPSSENIQRAAAYSDKTGGLALIIAHDGRILHESYAPGISPSSPQRVYSGTKAFWTVLGAAAVQDKLIRWDERASDTLTEWRGTAREKITIRQLLDMTAGLAPLPILHGDSLPNRNARALQAPLVAPPGQAFLYGPSQLQIFGELLNRKLAPRGQSIESWLRTRLLVPLGIPLHRVLRDSVGNPLQATGFTFTARDWLRWGNFLMRRGRGGPVPIFSIVNARTLQTLQTGSEPNPMYGGGFWLNHAAQSRNAREMAIEPNLGLTRWPPNACISRHAPPDMVVSVGSLGQRLYVIPSRKLVIVRLGRSPGYSDSEFLKLLFEKQP